MFMEKVPSQGGEVATVKEVVSRNEVALVAANGPRRPLGPTTPCLPSSLELIGDGEDPFSIYMAARWDFFL
jgi:hypothetical protein